ncbi:MAG: VOC family protein [Nocardioides sp.]|nr:VOC family protein [Nocardioides sp.]
MQLRHVSLPVRDPGAAAHWYADVLGLPAERTGDTWQVAVGSSVLTLRAGPGTGAHHLAFGIRPASFAASKAWLRARVPLRSRDGEDEFEGPPGWRSRSLYVDGPQGAVLELIARRDLPAAAGGAVAGDGGGWLGLSEVGIAVADVRATARRLHAELGVPAYAEEPGRTFAALGDVHGLLVLVAQGRRWYPTDDRYATAAAIDVEATDVGALDVAGTTRRTGACRVGSGWLRLA